MQTVIRDHATTSAGSTLRAATVAGADGSWLLREDGDDVILPLEPLSAPLAVEHVYEGVEPGDEPAQR